MNHEVDIPRIYGRPVDEPMPAPDELAGDGLTPSQRFWMLVGLAIMGAASVVVVILAALQPGAVT